MQCPKCASLNPDDAFFCGECGTQLRSTVSPPPGPVDLGGDRAADALPGLHATDPPAGPADPLPGPRGPGVPPTPHLDAALASAAGPYSRPQAPPMPAQPPPPPPPAGWQQPPTGTPGGYPPPMGSFGPNMPFAGNTSGMGAQYPAPPHAQGWSFAGFVPFGLFAFFNGITLWGILWWVLAFVGFSLVHDIYIGIKGRELAWQSRRFDSVEQYEATMRAWNTAGLIFVIMIAASFLLLFVFFMVAMLAALSP